MIICDTCNHPIPDGCRHPYKTLADPYGEEDWCKSCLTAFTGFYRKAKAFHMTAARKEVDAKMQDYLKGKIR